MLCNASQILNYTYRDYIHTWHRRINDNNDEFELAVRVSLQKDVTAFSDRLFVFQTA